MKKKRFTVDGKIYEIPDTEVASFIKDFPNAVEVSYYEVAGKKYNIPLSEVDAFETDMGIKKNVSGNGLQKVASSSSNGISHTKSPLQEDIKDEESIPTFTAGQLEIDPISLSKKYKELSTATKLERQPTMEGDLMVDVPDMDARKEAEGLKKEIESGGLKVDDINEVFGDFPEQAYEMTLEDGTKPLSKDNLIDFYKKNPIDAVSKINNTKVQFKLQDAAKKKALEADNSKDEKSAEQYGIKVGNYFTQLSKGVATLPEFYKNVQEKQKLINENLDGEDRDKALVRVRESMSKFINATDPELQQEYAQSPLKDLVTTDQYAGLKTLELFEPEKYGQVVKMLGYKITPEYEVEIDYPQGTMASQQAPLPSTFLTPDSTKGGQLSQSTIDQKIGKENVARLLNEIGRGNSLTALKAQQHNLNAEYEKTGNATILERFIANNQRIEDIYKDAGEDNTRYPLTAKMKIDQQIKDLVGQPWMGAVQYGSTRFMKGIQNTGNTGEDILTQIFGGEDANAKLQLQRVGEQMGFESEMYLPESYRSENESPFIIKASPKLLEKGNEILKGRNITDISYEEKNKLRDLVAKNQEEIQSVTNPNAGKSKNLFSKSTLYANAGFMGDIASLVIQTHGLTGLGAKRALSAFTPMFTTSYNDFYTQAIKEGKTGGQASEYALLNASIMGAAGLIHSPLDVVKKTLGVKTTLGRTIVGVSEKTWDDVIKKNAPILQKIRNSMTAVLSEAGKMATVYGAGTSIASDLVNKGFFNQDISAEEMLEHAVDGAKHILIGSIGLLGIGAITNFKATPARDKATLWELGDNKEIGLAKIDESVQRKEITPEQGLERKKVIEDVSLLIENMPVKNAKGEPLTDQQRVNYMYNLFIKGEAEKLKATLPKEKVEEVEKTIEEADKENIEIIKDVEPIVEPEAPKTEGEQTEISKPIELSVGEKKVWNDLTMEEKLALAKENLPEVSELSDIEISKIADARAKELLEKLHNPDGKTGTTEIPVTSEEASITNQEPIKVIEETRDAEIKRLEEERDSKIEEVSKPDLKLDFVEENKIPEKITRAILGSKGKNKGKKIAEEIVTKEELKKEQKDINDRFEALKKLIDCLTKKNK